MSRILYVGPITQEMDPSQPNWDTKLGRRKGKMSSHNGGGRLCGNPRHLCGVNF
jgi:hypothetical protein